MPAGSAPSQRGPAPRPFRLAFALAPLALVPAGAIALFALPGGAGPKAPPAPNAAETAAPPARGVSVSGQVVDAEGQKVAGARVWLVGADAPFVRVAERYSDAGGAFAFTNLQPGSFRVAAEHLHHGSALSPPVFVSETSEAAPLVLSLDAVRAVSGRVLNTEGEPVAGAKVSAEGPMASAPSTASAGDGAFWFERLPRVASSLRVSARGYVTEVVMLQTAAAVEWQALTVRLHAAPDIVGVVLDPAGRPVAATVTACGDGPDRKVARSGSDGSFRVPASASGCAFLAEHESFAASPSTHAAPGDQVVLRLGPGGSIDGRVVDDAGAPVRSFWVAFEPRAGEGGAAHAPAAHFVDDAGGRFSFASLAPGAYTLAVRADGYAPALAPTVDLASGARRSDLLVKLGRGGVIEGRIVDESRKTPLAGVKVALDTSASSLASFSSAPDAAPPAVTTDANGYYRLENVPQDAPVSVRVERPGGGTSLFGGLEVGAQQGPTGGGLPFTFNFGLALLASSQVRYEGVGLKIVQGKHAIKVAEVFDKGPADRAGVEDDDEFLTIDAINVERSPLADVVQRLRGPSNTKVRLRLRRPGESEIVDVVVTRKPIERPLVALMNTG
jgi:carboxypeptidase family protein/PDZ domain-containing protein